MVRLGTKKWPKAKKRERGNLINMIINKKRSEI
jgi:hypothetical protein